MLSFVNKMELNSLHQYLVGGVTPLGESNPDITVSSILDNFNNYDMAITITIKGSNKLRSLEGNLQGQYKLFKKIISTIIDEKSEKYIFYYELHKCGLWLHTHGVIKTSKKNLKFIKQEIFSLIEGQKIQKYQSYSRRINVSKIHDLRNWITYIQKDEDAMLASENSTIKKNYKI